MTLINVVCSDTHTYLDLVRTPHMRRVSLLSVLQLMLIACIFDATIRNITNLSWEFYTTFMASMAVGSPRTIAKFHSALRRPKQTLHCNSFAEVR